MAGPTPRTSFPPGPAGEKALVGNPIGVPNRPSAGRIPPTNAPVPGKKAADLSCPPTGGPRRTKGLPKNRDALS